MWGWNWIWKLNWDFLQVSEAGLCVDIWDDQTPAIWFSLAQALWIWDDISMILWCDITKIPFRIVLDKLENLLKKEPIKELNQNQIEMIFEALVHKIETESKTKSQKIIETDLLFSFFNWKLPIRFIKEPVEIVINEIFWDFPANSADDFKFILQMDYSAQKAKYTYTLYKMKEILKIYFRDEDWNNFINAWVFLDILINDLTPFDILKSLYVEYRHACCYNIADTILDQMIKNIWRDFDTFDKDYNEIVKDHINEILLYSDILQQQDILIRILKQHKVIPVLNYVDTIAKENWYKDVETEVNNIRASLN